MTTTTTKHLFNGLLSRNTGATRYQKDKTNLDFTEARDDGWQWYQLTMYRSAPCLREISRLVGRGLMAI